jgi:hypothetical protein
MARKMGMGVAANKATTTKRDSHPEPFLAKSDQSAS